MCVGASCRCTEPKRTSRLAVSQAFPHARIISVEYDTQLTDWAAVCPAVPETIRARTLKKRVCYAMLCCVRCIQRLSTGLCLIFS
jgi:hypothetical protein